MSDVVTGVTVNDRTTERSDAVFMANLLRELYQQEPAIVVKKGKVVGYNPADNMPGEGEFYAKPVPMKIIDECWATGQSCKYCGKEHPDMSPKEKSN